MVFRFISVVLASRQLNARPFGVPPLEPRPDIWLGVVGTRVAGGSCLGCHRVWLEGELIDVVRALACLPR